MNIEEKFAKGESNNTYLRIDSEYKVNVFLGYNDDGQMSMVITEYGKEAIVKSTKLINVSLNKREDGKMALSFDLLDNSYKSMFLIFCKDVILYCERDGNQMAISNALIRWKYWKEMFGRKTMDILSKQEIKGLIGELIELKDHFMKEFGEQKAIQSWMGPLSGHKDFEVDNTWYEIKSVSENAVQVSISSLEQLDSEVDGHLIVLRLEDASSTSKLAINLNKMVSNITETIGDFENMELFKLRLDNMGYVPCEEYENYNFVFKGRQSYSVTEKFPRLVRKEIPESIGNINYTIMLNSISEFKEN